MAKSKLTLPFVVMAAALGGVLWSGVTWLLAPRFSGHIVQPVATFVGVLGGFSVGGQLLNRRSAAAIGVSAAIGAALGVWLSRTWF